MKKAVSGIMLILLLIGMLRLAFNIQPVKAEPKTIYVPDDYETIQEAVDAADPGDTICVRAGTYYEKVEVDKTVSLIGENPATTIIDGGGAGKKLIWLEKTAHNTVITGFTLRNGWYGIFVDGSHGIKIYGNNIIAHSSSGIEVSYSIGGFIHRNCIACNKQNGVEIEDSSGYFVYHNNFVNNYPLQGYDDGEMSKWDDGYPSGGNYWSDYTGVDLYSGPYQNESGSDGIGDTPYGVGPNIVDNYPLMSMVVWDVAITNVTASPSEACIGENVSISVVARNEGNRCSETFNVTTYANTTIIQTQTVVDLAPGEEIVLDFTWDTIGVSAGNYTIKAEASVVPLEDETADNTYIDGTVMLEVNSPPYTPSKPNGPETGYTSSSYTYSTNTTDPNGHQVWYEFDWGDGTNTTVGPYNSSDTASASNIWYDAGTYNVTVRARDHLYAWSNWSQSLEVTISTALGYGCPFVYVWNGTDYVIDNNLLPTSETSGGVDVIDYYGLEQRLVSEDGKYSLLIREFEQEHDYLDQVRLLAVDHESDVQVAVSPDGEILTYKDPTPPLSALDETGADWQTSLAAIDGNYYEGQNGSYLLLDFGDLNVQHGAKLVMRADGPPLKKSIRIQVSNADGVWSDVAAVIPREYWHTEIVDLSSFLPDGNGQLKVRLCFTAAHKLDFVGLDATKQGEYEVHYGNIVSAIHSEKGNVKAALLESDDVYAELVLGEQIEIEFTFPENSEDARTYIIMVEGRYHTITGEN